MKVIFNYATRQFESMEPTMRERFALGSKDPSPKLNTDGQVAGALMNAFPGSNMSYLQAVEDGFQGSLEDFLKLQSIPQSERPLTGELDIDEQIMKDIEGQTAYVGFFKNLFKPSDEVLKKTAGVKTPERKFEINLLQKKDPENYTEAEKLFEKESTEKFKAIAADPLYKDLIPKKYKNIKSITEISQSDFKKMRTDFTNFQFKPITDEKGLGPYSTLSERLKNQVKGLYAFREKIKKRPNVFSLDIAGDKFDLPYASRISPKVVKNLEKVYPVFKKLEANPTAENYAKEIAKRTKGEQILIRDIQAYLTGVDNRARPLFEAPQRLIFVKSLNLENKLSKETIELIKSQKGRKAANVFKQPAATEAAQKINLEKVNTKSIKRINEIYSADPDATSTDVIEQYYGDAFEKALPKDKIRMLKDLRNDVITYYKIADNARPKPKGVRLPSKEKVDDILTSIMEGKGKEGFDIYGGYLRNIYSDIADSITKPGFKYENKISTLRKQFPGQHVDHSVGLTAVHEVAPGYVEAVQIIPKIVNQNKGRVLERASTKIINDFFTGFPNTPRKIGDKTYNTLQEKVDAFNIISKQFADANGVDTPLLRFGEPGKGPSPKETVEYFSEFSKGARDNMMEVWNNHGLVIYTKSRPMQSPYWKTLKDDIISKRQIKNMGGLISRVNFAEGTKIDQFLGTVERGPDPFVDQALAALENPNVANQFLKDNQPSVGEMILGKEGDRSLMQSFNTQFLDPRSFPYYAQKTLRGAANIPEFILSTPKAGYVFIRDLKKNAGITKESVEEIVKILDPEFTRDVLNGQFGDLLGLSDQAIQASEEKRTGPQRTTGEFLQLVGELPGPATPIFLLGYAPKLLKQLRDIGLTGASLDRVNKEIENKVAQQGVDQTRRDLLLSIGAGAGVGFLKYLGLDALFKSAPKAVAKQASEVITSGGTPKYFFDFVDLIKKKGKDISDEAAIVERQKVYDYNGYTLYENLDTNTIRITKDTEGASSYYIGDGEYDTVTGIIRKEEITYTPKETIINDKGKPVEVKDTYDEATVKPDYEGEAGDYETGLESIEEILDLLSKDGKTYSKEELLKMGIDLDAGRGGIPNVPTGAGSIPSDMIGEANPFKPKIKKAGGGIMKMAGDESGPPPKSGPTPPGLPYVAKNVRPIKERK